VRFLTGGLSGLKFNTVANLLAVILGLTVVVIAVRNHLSSSARSGPPHDLNASSIIVGTSVASIPDYDFRGAGRTLVLFLDAAGEDSNEIAPLFKELTETGKSDRKLFQTIALFTNDEQTVGRALKIWDWPVEHRSEFEASGFRLEALPTVLVVNQEGRVLKSWSGEISSTQEAEIMKALGLSVPHAEPPPLKPEKPVQIYDERKPVMTVTLPATLDASKSLGLKYGDLIHRSINTFDVDGTGNMYFTYQEHLLKVSPDGKVLKSEALPEGFQDGYCVDADANSYFYLQSKKIAVWSPDLKPSGVIELEGALKNRSPSAVKMAVDRGNRQLYMQAYEPAMREEALYRIDLQTRDVKVVYKLDAPYTVPTYGPGLSDWTLDDEFLYVSDPKEYRITTYSLKTGEQVGVFSRPFEVQKINLEDSRMQSIGRDLPYVLKPGAVTDYPAIWKISALGGGRLMVFTGLRDTSNRQLVHVYDQGFRLLGADFKFFRPGRNNHLVTGGLIYVADCSGEGAPPPTGAISPLDTPSLAYKLKVFRSRLN
jgi:sugar lactone lactonase YvrE